MNFMLNILMITELEIINCDRQSPVNQAIESQHP
jgi:hypothetical protein